MNDALPFTSVTPRHGLPLLYAGQAQKEVTVNEALLLADLLLHGAVEGERSDPPAAPLTGEMWLIGAAATGAWNGRDGQLAGWTESGWRYVAARPGMRFYDRKSRAFRIFDGQWRSFSEPAVPQGGAVVDEQARSVLGQLIAALSAAGIFMHS